LVGLPNRGFAAARTASGVAGSLRFEKFLAVLVGAPGSRGDR
jgi:hypothetical protein